MRKVRILHLRFVDDEMECEAKAPKDKTYCLMDDVDILSIKMLNSLKERIDYGISKRERGITKSKKKG